MKCTITGTIMIIATLIPTTATSVNASTGNDFDGDDFTAGHSARPPINPDFDPDYSCLFDVYQVQCIPGSQQECPENFGNNDDSTCCPLDENGDWVCPEGYHSREDDETGQCYPDSEGCEWDNYVMVADDGGEGNTCRTLYSICDEEDHKSEDYCIEYCEEDPERFGCREEVAN